MVWLWQRTVVKIWWMWRAVCNWLGVDSMVGWWASRVRWVDGQKLWFQGERLGSGGVVDVARVRRTNRGQGLRLERKRCEQEGVGWRRWDPWMQQWSWWVVGGGGKERAAGEDWVPKKGSSLGRLCSLHVL